MRERKKKKTFKKRKKTKDAKDARSNTYPKKKKSLVTENVSFK